MRFGPVPVGEAGGAILAHAVSLPGRVLKKGSVLSDEDVAALVAARIGQVTVARLDPGDVAENEAALRLARALVPEPEVAGLMLDPAFTGRVNIRATGPGVVALDAASVARLNAIDPMITLATVPGWQRVVEGTMVGTVKIISYAVDGAALEAACASGAGALRRVAPVLRRADLIVTEAPDGPRGATRRGSRRCERGLRRSTWRWGRCMTVPHDAGAVAAALAGATPMLLLILTASATSDVHDVAPAGLVAAGGRLIRFGMPVDPGNLLVLGAIGRGP
jgi:molybdenum cofactor cytidylyltransferase